MAMKHPPHPGGVIGDEIESLGLTIEGAALGLGIAPHHLVAVIEGRSPVSPEMALRLEKALGSSADMWLRLQVAHDLATIRNRDADIIVTRLAAQPAH